MNLEYMKVSLFEILFHDILIFWDALVLEFRVFKYIVSIDIVYIIVHADFPRRSVPSSNPHLKLIFKNTNNC